MAKYLQSLLEKIISSPWGKGLLGLVGVSLDYLYQLPVASKAIPVVLLFVMDTILGTLGALRRKKFSWKKWFSGLLKLLLYALLLVACSIVDWTLNMKVLTDVALAFVVGTEFMSILKNMQKLGVRFPKILVQKLEELIKIDK